MTRGIGTALAVGALLGAPAAGLAAPLFGPAGVGPAGWTTATAAMVVWGQLDLDGHGLGPTRIEVAPSADGVPVGPWRVLHNDTRRTASGPQAAVVPIADLEGRYVVRVVIETFRDGEAVVDAGELLVDRHAPTIDQVDLQAGDGEVRATWVQGDAGLAGSDPAQPTRLEYNTSAAGDGDGAWVPFDVQPQTGDGPLSGRTALGPLEEGRHLVRVVVADRAGNQHAHFAGVVYADRTPPRVRDVRVVRVPSAENPVVEVAYTVHDLRPGPGLGDGVPASLTGPGGRPVYAQARTRGGRRVIRAYLPGPSTVRLVVRVADRSGLVGESEPVTVMSPGPGGGLGRVLAEPLLGAGSPGSRPMWSAPLPAGSRLVIEAGAGAARRVAYGGRVRIQGQLLDPAGRPVKDVLVELRGRNGRHLGVTRTADDGRFAVSGRPTASGWLRVGVARDGSFDAARAVGRVRVVPRLRLRASRTRRVAVGEGVIFAGRLAPAPRTLVGSARKRVVLERIDPDRGRWVPMLDGRLDPDGRFRFRWAFTVSSPGYRMRARVRSELGWPLEPAVSPTVTVEVR